MPGATYEDLARRLTSDALVLFKEMVAADLESSSDNDRLFMRLDTWGGTRLMFTGDSPRTFDKIDAGALEDLLSYSLFHVGYGGKGTPNYRVGGEARLFYAWLMEQQGSPIAQTEDEMMRVVDSAAFAERHAGGAHHLREAFALLYSGRSDEQTVSEVGDHLRKALMDVTTDVVGADAGGQQEKPIKRLENRMADLNLPKREAAVVAQIVGLARVSLSLDHRLTHIRNESDVGEPPATWEEIRRAAFATALGCYELDRLRPR